MTAQIPDSFNYRHRTFAVTAVNGTGLFEPSQQGITVTGSSTDCIRGYYCTYEVREGALLLAEVNLYLSNEEIDKKALGHGSKVFGKTPERYTIHGHSTNVRTAEIATSW